MKNKIIYVVSEYIETSRAIIKELNDIFGPVFRTVQIPFDENLKHNLLGCDMVISSSKYTMNFIEQYTAPEVSTVVAEKILNMAKIPEILSIKSGYTVYVTGSSKEGAMEIIHSLREAGVNHLNMLPYYGQGNLQPYDVVISTTPAPDSDLKFDRVIEIEHYTLSIYTIIEIFIKLNMPANNLRSILTKFSQDQLITAKNTSFLNQNLQSILEIVSDGILCADNKGKVIFCNKAFSILTCVDHFDIISKNLDMISFDQNLKNILKNKNSTLFEVIDYAGKQILVNKQYISNSHEVFILSIQDITELQALENKVRKKLLHKGFVAKYTLNNLIGNSKIIKNKIEEAYRISKSDFAVLIQGNNGTGKEMFAQAIHNESARAKYPFVAVNIASLSDNLIESELFGYEEGAFTGALKGGKPGLFEMAHKGSIFIDEVGDISPNMQKRLLRVLQEKEVMRVGGNSIISVDVRIISATNKNLLKMVQEGTFRNDLYYRLKVLHINLPDLKDRADDIPMFVEYFFKTLSSSKYMDEVALSTLKEYSWPGNVRELQNLIYYIETLYSKDEITCNELPAEYKLSCNTTDIAHKINDFENISKLYGSRTIEDFRLLLTVLNKAYVGNTVVGRNKINDIFMEDGVNMTSEQIRNRLTKLSHLGFVEVGRTKQGSRITESGRSFLSYITDINKQ